MSDNYMINYILKNNDSYDTMIGLEKLSDEDLANQLKESGDQRFFAELTRRHEKKILKKCNSYVKQDAASEDLMQEILIKIFLRIKDFRNEAKFSTWLFTIIHSTCIDYLRKHKKNVHSVITEKLSDEVGDIIESEEEISEALSEKVLMELLEQMTPEEKMLLLLKYKEKHQIKDIQQTLNLSESAVKMRLKRAKEKINKLYLRHK
ncbi:RNA polymerase sigma factor (sigma-70 family) [Catalinimonas alkaloidigena]|uniref:RNA polymerase sigma factor n=1 Tax=Catalinimonas alkaloidigena TaxID=1075417 RepID=UPI002406C4BB|nr:RNA polymerase sigma factor [Catalinimonas alkaloidigena]MDF9797173.1 RNA polymerase sigma factor (sigma-70 family) [Catalinimonas alkaloidigena]